MKDLDALSYYAQHSSLTDPGRYAYMFDLLAEEDVPGLARVVAGLIMHPSATELYGEPPEPDNRGDGIRSVADTLEHLHGIDDAPLAVAREPRKRPRANCRNFAVLLVSMLRHREIPARKRVGFASYLPGPQNYIHEIAEYWDEARGRWVMVDPQNDDATLDAQRAYFESIGQPERADFDTFDIQVGESFYTGGLVWRSCRARDADPEGFRVGPDGGMLGIRISLLQDLDSLNKAELRSWDVWHELMAKSEEKLAAKEKEWLDQAAELMVCVDDRFGEMREFYATAPYARAVRSKLTALGLPT